MIPRDYITEWRTQAPWQFAEQVEQDLVISRALVELFKVQEIASRMALRGGTALHKLHLSRASRYSEDIDLVQMSPGAMGPVLDTVRKVFDPWLGAPKRDVGGLGATLTYRYQADGQPPTPMRLKIEINTREHEPAAVGAEVRPFAVQSRWFTGRADVRTFQLAEILGTKLRALYQRRKGRDLFDVALAMRDGDADPGRIVSAFERYMKAEGLSVSRKEFERNLEEKLVHPDFSADVAPLLGVTGRWEAERDAEEVRATLLSRLRG